MGMNELHLPTKNGRISQTLLAAKPDLKEYVLYCVIHIKSKVATFSYELTHQDSGQEDGALNRKGVPGWGLLGWWQYVVSGPGRAMPHWLPSDVFCNLFHRLCFLERTVYIHQPLKAW